MTTTTTTADAGAAAALADLFFHAPEDDKVNGDLRKRYRSWRSSSNGGHATADVLDLNHDAAARASRSKAGMRRVQTVGGKLSTLLPVRARLLTRTTSSSGGLQGACFRTPLVLLAWPTPAGVARQCMPAADHLFLPLLLKLVLARAGHLPYRRPSVLV